MLIYWKRFQLSTMIGLKSEGVNTVNKRCTAVGHDACSTVTMRLPTTSSVLYRAHVEDQASAAGRGGGMCNFRITDRCRAMVIDRAASAQNSHASERVQPALPASANASLPSTRSNSSFPALSVPGRAV